MCGFLVEYCFKDHENTSLETFESLLELSIHRGPDNSQIHTDSNYKLGFNRLSILDLSDNANQPISSPGNGYHLVFNGEIYNYIELIKEFGLKNLRSDSDTEVICQLLDKIGVKDTLNRLNGMYALTIIDRTTQKVHLSRDFAGIKPIFYGIHSNGIVCASQFDQVFKHPWFSESLSLRPEILKEYFGFGHMQAPNTIYKGIYQLYPGEMITIDSKGSVSRREVKKFRFKRKPREINYDDLDSDSVHPRLKSAVNRQLRSDVPLAAFLSGGIDSPLITAIASKLKQDLTSFTIGVDNDRFNEAEEARKYADHLEVPAIIKTIDESELLEIVDEHFEKMPEPFGDYSSVPTYLITKLARENQTVMLSGDGGDELFYGYPRMLDISKKSVWFSIPFGLRKIVLRILIGLKLFDSWGPVKYKRLEDWVRSKHCHLPEKLLNDVLDSEYSKEFKSLYKYDAGGSHQDLLHWIRWNEYFGHMQRVLVKVDRMSMANSMEVRVPFLDGELVKSTNTYIPRSFKEKKDLKKVLKELMRAYYPDDLIQTEKKGFSVPINDWLRGKLKDDLLKVVLNTPIYGNELMASEKLVVFVKDFLNNKHNSGWGVWHIYAWQKWAISQGLVQKK